MDQFNLKRNFLALRFIVCHLKQTKLKAEALVSVKTFESKKQIFYDWWNASFHLKRANRCFFMNSTRKYLELWKNGIINQRYLNICNLKATKLRKIQLKKTFLNYLRESLSDIKFHERWREQMVELSYFSHLSKLF